MHKHERGGESADWANKMGEEAFSCKRGGEKHSCRRGPELQVDLCIAHTHVVVVEQMRREMTARDPHEYYYRA